MIDNIYVWDTCAIIELLEDSNLRPKMMMALMDNLIQISAPTILELTSYAKPGAMLEERVKFLNGLNHSSVVVPIIQHYEAAGRWMRGIKSSRKTEKEDWKMDALIAATVWMQGKIMVGRDGDFHAIREKSANDLGKPLEALMIIDPKTALDHLIDANRQ